MMDQDEQTPIEWLVESEDGEGAIFFMIDPERGKMRIRVKAENYQLIEGKVFVRLGCDPEWFDPPAQCSIEES